MQHQPTYLRSRAATVWDAEALIGIGELVERYLSEHPAPSDAGYFRELDELAGRFQILGRADFENAGRL